VALPPSYWPDTNAPLLKGIIKEAMQARKEKKREEGGEEKRIGVAMGCI